MLDITTFQQLLNPTIVIACLIFGYIFKHWLKDVDNRIIPTMVCVIGVLIALIDGLTNTHIINIDTILSGAISGLASTGFHEMFRTWLDSLNG